MADSSFSFDVGVIGGGGHVGLPLAITLADCGLQTLIYDINQPVIEMVLNGEMPFVEDHAPEMLKRVLKSGHLDACHEPQRLSECRYLICIVGTPVDEHLNPSFTAIDKVLDVCRRYLRDGQFFILRSTVYPNTTIHVRRYFENRGLNVKVAFCPERVMQGRSIDEFRKLPQIISAFDEETLEGIRWLFSHFATDFVEMSPSEAEFCKLITNSWRYLQFAAANQFYMIATKNGLDFNRILHGCRYKYPRMADIPGAGFAAGPCLLKDTLQLAAFSENNFMLGHSAMLVNEGLPRHLIEMAKCELDLSKATAGILGMAFKAESDDARDSLSYKLKKLLNLEARRVLTTDPYVPDPELLPLEQVIQESDVLFVAAPHRRYRELQLPGDKVLVDVWNCIPGRQGENNEDSGDGFGRFHRGLPGSRAA